MQWTRFLSDEYFMKAASEKLKKLLQKDEVPVGAVVVCNNKIIARAHNLTETLNDPTAHAEMQVITAATSLPWRKISDRLYCLYYPRTMPMCAGALYWCQPDSNSLWCKLIEKRGYTH